jgi:aerobic carbon-monoxide dehydrogenase medium subunit
VKPAPFRYYDPRSVEEALELLAELGDEAKVLAGGQSLVPMMNLRLARPACLIDLNRIAALDYLRDGEETLVIGAMTRQRTVETSEFVEAKNPLLVEATGHIGHPTIRNRGTIGGSLAHADPAAEWPALAMALDATLVLRSAQAERQVAARDFFVGPLTTCLEPTELLAEVRVPHLARGAGWSFLELSRRFGDFALVGVAAWVRTDGSVCVDAGIALTGVGGGPVRARRAEEILRGERLGEPLFEHAARAVREEIEPDSDLHASADYRRTVAQVLTRRALAVAQKRLGGGAA